MAVSGGGGGHRSHSDKDRTGAVSGGDTALIVIRIEQGRFQEGGRGHRSHDDKDRTRMEHIYRRAIHQHFYELM